MILLPDEYLPVCNVNKANANSEMTINEVTSKNITIVLYETLILYLLSSFCVKKTTPMKIAISIFSYA